MVHYHGYMWTGPGSEVLPSDGKRSYGHPEFRSHGQLPYVVVDTLRKPGSFVRGTWDTPDDAAEWMRLERGKLGPHMYPEQQTMAPTIDETSDYNRGRLRIGKSVVWAVWLNGGRYADIRVVCCSPNDYGSDVPCPVGR